MTLPPWLDASWRELTRALAEERLHHGLLFAAPAGFGKRTLAEALLRAALCGSRRADGHACGSCRGCTLITAGTHPDLLRIGLEERDDGRLRSEITVDQLRALRARLALASQFGGLQLALIDPADAMNPSAANALLKTLEEPASRTILLLVADDASRLPATVRSRCQRVELRLPDHAQALAWLEAQGVARERAQTALALALENPGRALAWLGEGGLELAPACAEDLRALAEARAAPLEVADRWNADRPDARLWLAAVLALEEARKLARGEVGRFGLTARREIPKLARWSARANRARRLLATPLRSDLVLLDVLTSWPRRAGARENI